MKTTIFAAPCLLALLPSAWSAPAPRAAARWTAARTTVPHASRPHQRSLTTPETNIATPLGALATIVPPSAKAAAPAPAGNEAALAGLKAGADLSAQAGRSDEDNEADHAFGKAVFDTARVDELNAAVSETLQPLNDDWTKATAMFRQFEMNDKRATRAEGSVLLDKRGPDGRATLKIDSLDYNYPDAPGALPRTTADLRLDFDLRNQWTEEDINDGTFADNIIEEFLTRYAAAYQGAVTLETRITKKDADHNGNLTAIGLLLAAKFDLSKLPEYIDPRTIAILEGIITANIAFKLNSIHLAIQLVSNPDSNAFSDRQVGLREIAAGLLGRNPLVMKAVLNVANEIDGLIQYLATPHTRQTRKGFLTQTLLSVQTAGESPNQDTVALEDLMNEAAVANGDATIKPYDAAKFDLSEAKAELTRLLPRAEGYIYKTHADAKDVLRSLSEEGGLLRDTLGTEESDFLIDSINKLQSAGQIKAVVARTLTRASEDHYMIRHYFHIYASNGQVLRLHYSVGD